MLGNFLHKGEWLELYGAGASGLFLGYWLKQAGVDFCLYERGALAGGLLQTVLTNYGISESAANGIVGSAPVHAMLSGLGLPFLRPFSATRKRYIFRNGRHYRFPLGMRETGRALLGLCLPHRLPVDDLSDLSVGEFARAYLGKGFAHQLLEPALQGIYAAGLDELSFAAVFPSLSELLEQSRSLPLAWLKTCFWDKPEPNVDKSGLPRKYVGGTLGFAGGMGSLMGALARHLDGAIRYQTDAASVWRADVPSVICLPAYQAARLFDGHVLGKCLSDIRYLPMISVTLFVPQKNLPLLLPGFGCVVPRKEGLATLGVLFNHHIFEGRAVSPDMASLTVILRGDGLANRELFSLSDEHLLAHIYGELKTLFGMNADPLHTLIHRWERGLPLYEVALQKKWTMMHNLLLKDFPHTRLLGNYTGQISLRGICNASYEAVMRR